MKELSEKIVAFLNGSTLVTNFVSNRITPLVAKAGTSFPFCVYRIAETSQLSKDAVGGDVGLFFYVAAGDNAYSILCDFADAVKIELDETDFEWLNATIDTLGEDTEQYVLIINLTI